jgi:glycerol-3-phosphate acyltransferase PlsX
MSTTITVALDAMGGDHGPKVIVPAALSALDYYPQLSLILVGDETILKSLLIKKRYDTSRLRVHHASEQVAMDEPPAQALRYKKDSSMRVALNLVKDGIAGACVSAGNTGALLATARFVLKMLPGIDRPALIGLMPTTVNSETMVRVLDLGANIDSTATHLLQFAAMGHIVSHAIDGVATPRIALLNIGEEEIKGNEVIKQASQLFAAQSSLNYIGFVEANDIFTGKADVIVCDGFIGNIALKACEGTARMLLQIFKAAIQKSILARLAIPFLLPVLNKTKKQFDPARYNGASFLGLNGVVVKSHGNAKEVAFRMAIYQALRQAEQGVPQQIASRVELTLANTQDRAS